MTPPPREVVYTESALAFLEGLPKKLQKQIIGKVARLAADPKPPGSKVVRGATREDGEPVYRIRQGDYRVLYVADESVVTVLDIGHRKDIYR